MNSHSTWADATASWPSPWIVSFLNRPENSFMCVVDESFIRDGFNMQGLDELVPAYRAAVRTVLGDGDPEDGEPATTTFRARNRPTATAAELLYGLTHARFVMTESGVAKMHFKFLAGCFGQCPRINCKRSHMLPVGLHDEAGQDTVKLFCPRCIDVYEPEAGTSCRLLDGAYFGTGFPQMFFMTRPSARPTRPDGRYNCRLYGFRIHKSAVELQRYAATRKQINQTMFLSQTMAGRPNATTAHSTANIGVFDNHLQPTTSNVNVTARSPETNSIRANSRQFTTGHTRSAAKNTAYTIRK